MKRSRWPSVDASAGQVSMLGVAKWSASLHRSNNVLEYMALRNDITDIKK